MVLVATVLALGTIPADGTRVREKFDLVGAAGFTLALVSLMGFLNSLPREPRWWMLAIFAAAFAVFVMAECKSQAPLINLEIFRNRKFSLINGVNFLLNLIMYSVLFSMLFYLEEVYRLSPARVGTVILGFAG